MLIYVNDIEINYQLGSIDIDGAIGQRSTASFVVVDKVGDLQFYKGNQVEIWNDDKTVLLFGGVIDRPVSKYMSLVNEAKFHDIQCADWHYYADKRIIAKAYKNMRAGDIVKDIITLKLADEGITVGEIFDGPLIEEAVFNYSFISDALDKIAETATFTWHIDENKELNFFDRPSFWAPVSTLKTQSDIKNVSVEPAADDYRNRQYIKAGKDTTDVQTESFIGDGKTQTFTVGYEIAKVPSVFVNDVAQTVGIGGVDKNKQWYWNKGERFITQEKDNNPLTTSQELRVEYQGLFDIIILSYDQGAIDEMQGIEGGTGIHENIADEPDISSRMAAFQSANAKLNKYARIGTRLMFDTKTPGYKPGQLVNVDLPSFYIENRDFLVKSVKARELGTADGRLTYQIECFDTRINAGWVKFFKQMATPKQTYVIYENIQEDEVLILLESFTKTWQQGEAPEIFKDMYPSSTLYPSTTLYPAFGQSEKIKYLSLFDANGNEFFRKSITKHIFTATQIQSTTTLQPYEANNKEIHEVAWFGGNATSAFNTGVLIEKLPYVKQKNDGEIIQIDRTDLKGW